jgi:predicted GH43/DUF377 family glycosyl hydrolase
MIAVLNISPKDWALAADNLEWSKKLDGGKIPYDCLLAHDTSIEQHALATVEKAARQYFRNVELFCYAEPQETDWPMGANHAWQSCALHIGQYINLPWFWWEADATPLKPGWLHDLHNAYTHGGKPFAGHIVPDMGHMNGVACYPPVVAKYCPKALYCRAAPFDVMLREETIDLTAPLNHLICHYPRNNAVKCQVKDPEVPIKMHERGYVIFHGCNDGSIIKVINGEKPFDYGDHPSVKIFGVSDIGRRVDEAESFYHKEAIALYKNGHKVISYEECRAPIQRIRGQAKDEGWEADYFDLPTDVGLCHMNSGYCVDDEGQAWLVTRKWVRREKTERSWHSTLMVYRVWETPNSAGRSTPRVVGDPIELKMSGDPFEESEDPRVIFRDGKFYVSYCSWSQRSIYHARQIFAEFDRDWKPINSLKVPYGLNDFKPATKMDKVAEKNWAWFWHDGSWHFVYSASPHVVVKAAKKRPEDFKTENKLNWKYGEIRGGTPPVRIGDEYFTFFHSSLPWRGRQKRYYMGAYAFEAKAPFRITKITPAALLRGSESDTRINRGPLVVFPCGAVLENGTWTLTAGVNDEGTAWIRLPHDDLLQRMTPV